MKNKIILPLIAIIFLSSCANKFSLTKRKYTKGYYFASSTNKNSNSKEADNKNIVVKNLPAKKASLPASEKGNEDIKETPLATFYKTESPKEKNNNTNKSVKQIITASAAAKKSVTHKPLIKAITEKEDFINKGQKKGSDADLNLVIMIILCLFPFINLIPVYLHDGKKLTLNFLITLLLDFTWILGVIYAILVVLDVVDLA